MKNLYMTFLLTVLMSMVGAKAFADDIPVNSTTFPDENFRKWVLEQDYGQDGVLTEAEIAEVNGIDVSNKNIASLKGIEYFTALTELECYNNQLTALDLSKNTALTYLECSWNQLTALDVSKNTALTVLYCDGNQLTALDVSKNTALKELDCSWNQLTALDVSKNTALTGLDCYNNQLTALDVSKNTALTYFNCSENQLTALDLSKNTALTFLNCSNNQINETEMGNLVESLPANNGVFRVKSLIDANEQNFITTTQVAAAKAKGWKVYAWDSNVGDDGEWIEYDGDEPQDISPIDQGEAIDFGNDIDEDTNLDGNVVGNVFININDGDGSYNPTDGCIIVNKPTDDNAIDGKDIFGEDFKDNYTGIVFKVNEGKGTIKVEAETQGNMVLKVKIGNSDPIEMELDGKLKVKFPYDVTEETLVYIYGGTSAAGAKASGARRAPSDADALKIYGIEVENDSMGIDAVDAQPDSSADTPVYNLNGQRVNIPVNGVYIKNGRKVLVK